MSRITLALCLLVTLFMVLQPAQAGFISVQQSSDTISIATSSINVSIPKINPAISIFDKTGASIFSEKRTFSYKNGTTYYYIASVSNCSTNGDTVTLSCTGTQTGVNITVTLQFISPTAFKAIFKPNKTSGITKTRTSIIINDLEHIYGLGEPRTGSLDLRGKQVDMWIDKTNAESMCFVPFYISTQGYGLYVDSYLDGTFDIDYSEAKMCKVIWPKTDISWYFFYGPEADSIVKQYTDLTGKPALPPIWQFGLAKWLRPQGADQNAILQDAQLLKSNDIPASIVWVEPQWETDMNSMTFRTDIFPDPIGFIQQLHNMGYKVAAWDRTDIFDSSPNYQEALLGNYFVMTSSGKPWLTQYKDYDYFTDNYVLRNRGFIDFTNPEADAFWQRQMQRAISYGFDGFKVDRGYEIGSSCKFKNGESGVADHNKYPYYMIKSHYNYLHSVFGDDFLLLVKTGVIGSQAYTTFRWTGDQPGDFSVDGLPAAVLAAQTAGLAGFPYWTSDIAGWRTIPPDQEAYIRWTAFSAFTPGMETCYGPWDFDEATTDIFRKYTKLHYELIPFLYSLGYRSHITGLPIMKPLIYKYRTDDTAAKQDSEFLVGDEFLVAPVVQKGVSGRFVYLPQGKWIDYWDNSKTYTGPVSMWVDAPLDKIPVFLKAGALIPKGSSNPSDYSSGAVQTSLTLDTYPDGNSNFTAYVDGHTANISCTYTRPSLKFELSAFSKTLTLRAKIRDVAPTDILVNGSALLKAASEEALASSPNGWFWTEDGRILLKFVSSTDATVEAIW